jgi:hypothetical protein
LAARVVSLQTAQTSAYELEPALNRPLPAPDFAADLGKRISLQVQSQHLAIRRFEAAE